MRQEETGVKDRWIEAHIRGKLNTTHTKQETRKTKQEVNEPGKQRDLTTLGGETKLNTHDKGHRGMRVWHQEQRKTESKYVKI